MGCLADGVRDVEGHRPGVGVCCFGALTRGWVQEHHEAGLAWSWCLHLASAPLPWPSPMRVYLSDAIQLKRVFIRAFDAGRYNPIAAREKKTLSADLLLP